MQHELSSHSFDLSKIFCIGNIEAYRTSILNVPILSHEREIELGENLKENNCLHSAQELILSHLRFVAHVAKSYTGYGLEQEDLIQEGNIGLMKAVKRFDVSHGVRLVSFAVHWIKAEIHDFVLKNWRTVKIATTKAQRKLFFNLRKNKKGLNYFTDIEATELAEKLGVKKKDVLDMEGRLSAKNLSYDVSDNSDDDNFSPALFLEDKTSDFSQQVAQESEENDQKRLLNNAMNLLSERDKDIVQLRWISETKSTLTELGNKYDISAERVRQLEKNAFKKLRENML